MRPCIHGDLCFAYMLKFGKQKVTETFEEPALFGGTKTVKRKRVQACIYSVDCPKCEFYEPKGEK